MHSKALVLFATAAALAVCATSPEAQMRRQPGQAAGVPVEVALQVGANKYNASGQGECKSAESGSIYGILASQSSVSHGEGGKSLHLTLWQPKNGPAEMMTLFISVAGKRYNVDTVKAPAKRDTKGSGHTKLQRNGAGAVFTVDAVAGGGEKISGTIKCGSFMPIEAEGG